MEPPPPPTTMVTSMRWVPLILLFMFRLSAADETMTPPLAKIVPKTLTLFGDARTDNYYWLRDRTNPETLRYLEAENLYTEARMRHTADLQKQLYTEMLGRIQQTDST